MAAQGGCNLILGHLTLASDTVGPEGPLQRSFLLQQSDRPEVTSAPAACHHSSTARRAVSPRTWNGRSNGYLSHLFRQIRCKATWSATATVAAAQALDCSRKACCRSCRSEESSARIAAPVSRRVPMPADSKALKLQKRTLASIGLGGPVWSLAWPYTASSSHRVVLGAGTTACSVEVATCRRTCLL